MAATKSSVALQIAASRGLPVRQIELEESFEPSYPCGVDDLVMEEIVCSSCGNIIPDCTCYPDRDSISEWE